MSSLSAAIIGLLLCCIGLPSPAVAQSAADSAAIKATAPAEGRRTDVQILDVFQDAASVRVDAHGWIDYMHMARLGNEWKIVNVLWEIRARSQ